MISPVSLQVGHDKDPPCSMTGSAEHCLNFATLHWQWWRPHMREVFSNGAKINKSINLILLFTQKINGYAFKPVFCFLFWYRKIRIALRNPVSKMICFEIDLGHYSIASTEEEKENSNYLLITISYEHVLAKYHPMYSVSNIILCKAMW